MKKGDKKKRELQQALKELTVEKGYANVTMKDIGERVGLSVGGLYHHYHDVEDIFADLIASEVYEAFKGIGNFDGLMTVVDAYFEQEKRELLSEEISINIQMLEDYFSHPEQERHTLMKASHDEVVQKLSAILLPVYKDEKAVKKFSEHIFITLQGLVVLLASGAATEQKVDCEFDELREFLNKKWMKKLRNYMTIGISYNLNRMGLKMSILVRRSICMLLIKSLSEKYNSCLS